MVNYLILFYCILIIISLFNILIVIASYMYYYTNKVPTDKNNRNKLKSVDNKNWWYTKYDIEEYVIFV